jgi:hypothetical protein
MTTNPMTILIILAALLLPGAAFAAPETVIISADIISVPQAVADSLLNGADIKDHAELVLGKLHQMISSRQAVSIANPSFQSALGSRDSSTGLAYLLCEIKGASLKNFDVSAEIKYAGQQLLVSSSASPGTVLFAGTFEPGKEATAASQGATCLVFLRFQ